MELNSTLANLEARWDENGARCLDTPRALDATRPELAALFPDIEAAIAQECPRPPGCANTEPTIYDPGDLVISGNYD
jgi:hypothetical protein